MIRIYPSSLMKNAQMWIDLSKENQIHYVAQWITHFKYKDLNNNQENAVKYWVANLRDIKDCDILISYGESDDILGGSLIEIGAALAYNKRVFLVGQNEAFRSWRHHPLVTKYDDMDKALDRVCYIETWGCEI